MMKSLILIFFFLFAINTFAETWQIGAGKADITYFDSTRAMMGFGRAKQRPVGIKNRLYARAFVFKQANQLAGYVIIDMQGVSVEIKKRVLKLLAKTSPLFFSEKFSEENLMIAATHNHSGPGGVHDHQLYDLTSDGLDAALVKKVSEGIAQSVLIALANLRPGRILFNQGKLKGVATNRSMIPHLADKVAMTAGTNNETMSLLKFLADDGTEIGTLNWFAIHGTSISSQNNFITHDNKGLASLQFEQSKNLNFVAGFANNEEGDVSPVGRIQNDQNYNQSDGGWAQLEKSGKLQSEFAQKLYAEATVDTEATVEVKPELAYVHDWHHMPSYVVKPQYTGNKNPQQLCRAALGLSFTAGTEDGPGYFPGIYEGMVSDQYKGLLYYSYFNVLTFFAQSFEGLIPSVQDRYCQGKKPVFIATGQRKVKIWTPDTIPFQILRLGNIALLGVSSEMTTNAGFYLRKRVLKRLKSRGIKHVIISGLSNSYSSYVSTEAEFNLQHYEGASTLFGPNTLNAYLQIFDQLSERLGQ